MTTLDNATLEYIMESLGYHYDRQDGPREQFITIGPNMYDYRFYTAWDIREWLAGLMHRPWLEFMRDGKPDDIEINELPTHMRVVCSCGEFEKIEPITSGSWQGMEHALTEVAGEHVETEIKKILDRYKYDENYGNVDD